MRFFAGLLTLGVLVAAGEIGFVGLKRYGACAANASTGCSGEQHLLSIALLAFMAAVAALGAILGTRRRAHHESPQ